MTESPFSRIRQMVLDTTDARLLAEFYRRLFGLTYRPGDEDVDPAGDDWLVLRGDGVGLAFQLLAKLPRSTWPTTEVPQHLHLDTTVPSIGELFAQRDRALALGATLLRDRSGDPDEPLYVFADPAGHPFCLFVAPDACHLDGACSRRPRARGIRPARPASRPHRRGASPWWTTRPG